MISRWMQHVLIDLKSLQRQLYFYLYQNPYHTLYLSLKFEFRATFSHVNLNIPHEQARNNKILDFVCFSGNNPIRLVGKMRYAKNKTPDRSLIKSFHRRETLLVFPRFSQIRSSLDAHIGERYFYLVI